MTASTFDVAFKDFQTWKGKTDANGHVKFEIKLPDYFVGQPLQKGNALVKLEVEGHRHGRPHRDDHARPTRSATSRSASA